jgi:hypothetical protein
MTKVNLLTATLYMFCVFAAFAQSPARRIIEVYSFMVVDGPGDKEQAANDLTNKIRRFSGKVLSDCPDLSLHPNLINVGKLEVRKLGDPTGSFEDMVDIWRKVNSVLEIISGTLSTKKDSTKMDSDVYLGDLKDSLKSETLTIHTEMTGSNLGPLQDLHCALALYALAMDLKHRYPLAKDAKEKKIYIAIISRYLGQVPLYFPPHKADSNEIDENQKELSQAVQQEMNWCKEEAGKL